MQRKKILLIEDELLIQKSLKKLLELRGAIVETESLGRAAIQQIFKENYDRIICDLMLQDISGFDVLEEAKKKYSPDFLSSIFIIITAYSSHSVLERAKAYGCRVITKPFENLQTTIDTLIEVNGD